MWLKKCKLFCYFLVEIFIFFCVNSYEVLMLTSKCGVCGLPDRGPVGLGHGQFPCGHSAIGGHPRRTSNVSVGSLYNNHTMADSASPAQSPTAHFLGIGGVGPQQQLAATPTPYSPVKDSSSKSLLASICRYYYLICILVRVLIFMCFCFLLTKFVFFRFRGLMFQAQIIFNCMTCKFLVIRLVFVN